MNPYTKVWDTVEESESDIQKSLNNGTLFAPSYEELGKRSASSCRYYLRQARKLGNTIEGREAFEEALYHHRMADAMFKMRDKVNRVSR